MNYIVKNKERIIDNNEKNMEPTSINPCLGCTRDCSEACKFNEDKDH